jgi:hypothetical protein
MEQQHKPPGQEMEVLRKQQHFTEAGSATRNINNAMDQTLIQQNF